MEVLVADTLRHFREAGQLRDLFDKLTIFIRLISGNLVPPIIRAIYRGVPDLSRSGADPWDTEYERAKGFLLRLIDELGESTEVRSLVEEVVREVSSLPFAVLVVHSCHQERGGCSFKIYEHCDIGALRRQAADRLYAHYVQGDRDIFEELPEKDLGFVLYQWGTNWMTGSEENRRVVQEYVLRLIDRRPEYLGRLLTHFMERGLPAGRLQFAFGRFSSVYDPTAVADRLRRYGVRALTTLQDREAARMFREVIGEVEEGGQ